jgi:hypothetical protein
VLIVDGVDGGATNGAAPSPPARPSPTSEPEGALEDLEDEDPEVLDSVQGGEDHQASAVDRLLQTFPGASEVAE